MIEAIRVKLASGLYTKSSLWLDMKHIISHEDFDDIAEYRVKEEIRSDLKERISQLVAANKYYADYQDELQLEAQKSMISASKHYPFAERKEVIDSKLSEKIGSLSEISIQELPKFYQV